MGTSLLLDDLYRFERVGDPCLNPDATLVAYAVTTQDRDTDSGCSRIWLAPAGGGESRVYTAGPQDRAPRWSPDGKWLAFLRQPAEEGPQLWVLPAAGGDAVVVDSGPVLDFAWSPDSASFAVIRLVDPAQEEPGEGASPQEPVVVERFGYKADGAGLLGRRRTHLFTITRSGENLTPLTQGDFSVAAPAWSPTGDRIAVITALHESRDIDAVSHVATVDLGGGQPRMLTDWEGAATWVGWLPDGRLLIAGLDEVDTNRHNTLFTVPAGGGKPEPLLGEFDRNVMTGHPGYPGAPPQVAGDAVLFCARDRGTVHLYRVAINGGAPDKLVNGDERLVMGCSVVGNQLVYVLANPVSPGEVIFRPLRGGQERRLSHHNRFIDQLTVHTGTSRTFSTPDGHEVHGRVIAAKGFSGARPLLLDIHGGPHNAWGPALDDVHLYHQRLADEGWIILTLNTIGSDGYGQDWYSGLRGAWGRADEAQFLGAIDTLIEEGLADPNRIAVTGYSYGGYMTNWLVSRTDRFAAAVTGGCVANLASFYGTADFGPLLACEIGVDLADDPQRYSDLSPLTRATAVTTPTLILHGEEDHRCPVGQAEEWFTALHRQGVPSRLVRYPGAGHLFILDGRPSHRLHYNEQVVEWLTEHVA